MKHATQWDTVNYPNDPSDDRIQGDEWNQRHVWTLEAEPDDPDENEAITWMSNGTGYGDAGDVVMKINVAGDVRYCTCCDFSALTANRILTQSGDFMLTQAGDIILNQAG